MIRYKRFGIPFNNFICCVLLNGGILSKDAGILLRTESTLNVIKSESVSP